MYLLILQVELSIKFCHIICYCVFKDFSGSCPALFQADPPLNVLYTVDVLYLTIFTLHG